MDNRYDFTCPGCGRDITHGHRVRDVCSACYSRWHAVKFEGDMPPPPRMRGPSRRPYAPSEDRASRISIALSYRGRLDRHGMPLTMDAIAERMGLAARTIARYYQEAGVTEVRTPATNGQQILDPPAPVADADQVHVAWHIAAYAGGVAGALTLADELDIPRVAFSKRCYVAPAAELFTGWHLEGRPGWTRCGRKMTPDGLWQHVAREPGDTVCRSCRMPPPVVDVLTQDGLF